MIVAGAVIIAALVSLALPLYEPALERRRPDYRSKEYQAYLEAMRNSFESAEKAKMQTQSKAQTD